MHLDHQRMHFHFLVSGSPWYHEDWEYGSNVKPQSGCSHHPRSRTTVRWGKTNPQWHSHPGTGQQISVLSSCRCSRVSWCFPTQSGRDSWHWGRSSAGGGRSSFRSKAFGTGEGLHHRCQLNFGPGDLGCPRLVSVEGEYLWRCRTNCRRGLERSHVTINESKETSLSQSYGIYDNSTCTTAPVQWQRQQMNVMQRETAVWRNAKTVKLQ